MIILVAVKVKMSESGMMEACYNCDTEISEISDASILHCESSCYKFFNLFQISKKTLFQVGFQNFKSNEVKTILEDLMLNCISVKKSR